MCTHAAPAHVETPRFSASIAGPSLTGWLAPPESMIVTLAADGAPTATARTVPSPVSGADVLSSFTWNTSGGSVMLSPSTVMLMRCDVELAGNSTRCVSFWAAATSTLGVVVMWKIW